jgi:hypothetical protein
MACSREGKRDNLGPHHILSDPSPNTLAEAKRNVQRLDVALITDMYDESYCAVRYKMEGVLPHYCAVNNNVTAHGNVACVRIAHGHRATHGVPSHSSDALEISAETNQMVDAITGDDNKLYAFAAAQTLLAIAKIEEITGTRFLCQEKKDTMAQLIADAKCNGARGE